ncbi:uncharacterized protein BO80DRAFT_319921, partial [Aspergillus ibericus CBS 121593]
RDKEINEQFQICREELKDFRTENTIRDKETKRNEFANVYNRFSVVDARLDAMNATLSNSKLAYLPQKITPFPMFDDSNNRLPIPECFPTRLSTLVSLKNKRHWPKLRELLTYYQLEAVTIQVIYDQDTGFMDTTDGNSGGSHYKYTEQQLQDAIESDPEQAIDILASHLGIAPVVRRRRTSSHEFGQMVQQIGKRVRQESDRGPAADTKPGEENVPSPSSANFDWDAFYDAHGTVLDWEPDESKFRRETAHLVLRDT